MDGLDNIIFYKNVDLVKWKPIQVVKINLSCFVIFDTHTIFYEFSKLEA